MRQKSVHPESPSERIVKNIRRATRKRHSSEDKIRIVLDGLRGEASIAELCRREGIAESLYYAWSKEFLEAGKRRLAGDTARAATNGEVKDLRHEAQELKAVVAEQALELRLLKKSMIADGETRNDTPLLRNLRSSAWSSNPTCQCAGRWRSWGSSLQGSTAGTIGCRPAAPKRWRINHQGRSASGTVSLTQYASGSFSWRWMSPSYRHGSWPRASPIRLTILCRRLRCTGCSRRMI